MDSQDKKDERRNSIAHQLNQTTDKYSSNPSFDYCTSNTYSKTFSNFSLDFNSSKVGNFKKQLSREKIISPFKRQIQNDLSYDVKEDKSPILIPSFKKVKGRVNKIYTKLCFKDYDVTKGVNMIYNYYNTLEFSKTLPRKSPEIKKPFTIPESNDLNLIERGYKLTLNKFK